MPHIIIKPVSLALKLIYGCRSPGGIISLTPSLVRNWILIPPEPISLSSYSISTVKLTRLTSLGISTLVGLVPPNLNSLPSCLIVTGRKDWPVNNIDLIWKIPEFVQHL